MANILGRTVTQRYFYARSWSLGDRRSPAATTPCLISLADDLEMDYQVAPFSAISDDEIPQTLTIRSNLPLSPPDFNEKSPSFTSKVGHVLPPSLDEADAGEPAGNGGLLPISWQRLNHDKSLMELKR